MAMLVERPGPRTGRPSRLETVLVRGLNCSVRSTRLQANRRVSQAQALFLAQHSTALGTDGRRIWLFDPVYQRTIPNLEDWPSIWSDAERRATRLRTP